MHSCDYQLKELLLASIHKYCDSLPVTSVLRIIYPATLRLFHSESYIGQVTKCQPILTRQGPYLHAAVVGYPCHYAAHPIKRRLIN